ncbi:hypothetical protein MB02_11770 [Croceicoccus estronivorus]|uniref:RidA family protein n=1 Tax=Croceicoccus estronivorus TaxID=1172626 RepID=UPI0008374453|nr:RidA family protein [Croceicoccus estronivorus]OCC23309.1 hypothetical protein MB02_11770 [Croceicoccus estronivorus]
MSETAPYPAFASAVRVDNLVFCSGQIGLEKDGTVPLDPERQFRLAFESVGAVLAQFGCTAENIVELTTFHVGFPSHMEEFASARSAFLDGEKSAWTAIGVAALGYPDSIVEIKAVAKAVD